MIRTPYTLEEMTEEPIPDRIKYVVAAVQGSEKMNAQLELYH